MKNGEGPMRLKFTLHGAGKGELEVDTKNFLVAPLRTALEGGRPADDRVQVIFQTSERELVLGSFLQTEKDRILFFPASAVRVANEDSPHKGLLVDHLALDPPTEAGEHRSHVTFRGSRNRRRLPTRVEVQGMALPWFSLLIPDLKPLSRLPKTLTVRFDKTRDDPKRFAERVLSGRPGIAMVPVELSSVEFLQIDAWVARGSDWKEQAITVHRFDRFMARQMASDDRWQVKMRILSLDLGGAGVRLIFSVHEGDTGSQNPRFFFPALPTGERLTEIKKIQFVDEMTSDSVRSAETRQQDDSGEAT